mmetsp:Transcript_38271/g.101907  ORF Transcript_38271/g.101907 Transcript_38271/m.101907 type:complete len:212 (+) Transcript_38271:393-1028(+)
MMASVVNKTKTKYSAQCQKLMVPKTAMIPLNSASPRKDRKRDNIAIGKVPKCSRMSSTTRSDDEASSTYVLAPLTKMTAKTPMKSRSNTLDQNSAANEFLHDSNNSRSEYNDGTNRNMRKVRRDRLVFKMRNNLTRVGLAMFERKISRAATPTTVKSKTFHCQPGPTKKRPSWARRRSTSSQQKKAKKTRSDRSNHAGVGLGGSSPRTAAS